MSYPSFLWNRTLRECSEIAETIPENVLTDLTLAGEMKPAVLEYFRKPCSAEEIPQRQGLFRLLLTDDGAFREHLLELAEQLSELHRLLGSYDRAETQTERVMLFLPSLGRYLGLAKMFAGLNGYAGRAGEIGAYFDAVCAREEFRRAEGDYSALIRNRRSELLFTVRGTEMTASEGGTMTKAKLEQYFTEMGVPEAIPTRKAPLRTNEAIAAAYAGVYFGFHASSERFYETYAGIFLEGDMDIHSTAVYMDEIRFLLETSEYFARLSEAGYPLTYSAVSEKREIVLNGIVDASLAKRELRGEDIVPNDLLMAEDHKGERLSFYIVTGANGGGKTTFIRACGLAVLLFLTGCPVTAESARMYPFRAVYSHFPANESFENSGRFVNEANRAEEIIAQTDCDTFALFNETYSGTDEQKSEQYSRRLADTMYERGVFGMFVTHIHSLTGSRIPTLAAVIDETDDNRRTYKIRRVGATASSFAEDILEKYRLDRNSLKRRMEQEGVYHG